MPDIPHLMELLKSGNPNQRYDACEQLRVSRQPLSQDVIDALSATTSDANPDVADAARRALALHAPQLKPVTLTENEAGDKATTDTANLWFRWVIASSLSIMIGGPAVLLLLVFTDFGNQSQIPYILAGLLLGAILGASQAFVLQNYGYSVVRWITLSALGLAVGTPVGFFIHDHNLTISGYVVASAIGFALGIAQTAGFPDYSHTHLVWIPVSMVSVIVIYFIVNLVNPFSQTVDSPEGAAFILCQAALFTIPFYGLITGLVIQWITQRRQIRMMSIADK